MIAGEGRPADREWTRGQFIELCRWMFNDNCEHNFMLVYRDDCGQAHFAKAKNARVDRRMTWAWETIIGKSKSKVGIGFYPSNERRMSRWGAIDFDAHDGGAARARTFAGSALEELQRHPHRYLILGTSGSRGWHLFILTEEFHPVDEWTLFLKRITTRIGAPVRPGCCELFPNETSSSSWPYGIRAPGTWNPKTDQLGLIVFDSTGPLLERLCAPKGEKEKEREKSPFLYHSSRRKGGAHLNDSERFYSGGAADWRQRFAILHGGTRHDQLCQLVHMMLRQVGYAVARWNAERQYLGSRIQSRATLAEHLEEFDELWKWNMGRWREDLSSEELAVHDSLASETERDLFRILRNFARHAVEQGRPDFAFPIVHVNSRLGVSFQHISKLRQRLVEKHVISQTATAKPNSAAARFAWCLSQDPPI
jgi:hypothetical protein